MASRPSVRISEPLAGEVFPFRAVRTKPVMGKSHSNGNCRSRRPTMANKQGQGDEQGGKKGGGENAQQQQGSQGKEDEKQQGNEQGARRGQSTAGNQGGTPGPQNSGRPGKGGS
jgi:hypothetical protein